MLYTEVPFLDRYALAAEDGFEAVEFLFPYAWPASEIRRRLDDYGLQLVLHNLPAGDWDAGERGIACHPDRVEEFRAGVGRAIEYAQALGVKQLNCLAGKAPAGVEDAPARHLHRQPAPCGQRPEAGGPDLLIEPINTLDIPGLPEPHGPGRRHPGRDRRGQRLPAVRHLSRAAHGGRAGGHAAPVLPADPPRTAGRQPGRNSPAPARSTIPICSPCWTARLRRLGRLRIQARHHHGRRPGLAQALAR